MQGEILAATMVARRLLIFRNAHLTRAFCKTGRCTSGQMHCLDVHSPVRHATGTCNMMRQPHGWAAKVLSVGWVAARIAWWPAFLLHELLLVPRRY